MAATVAHLAGFAPTWVSVPAILLLVFGYIAVRISDRRELHDLADLTAKIHQIGQSQREMERLLAEVQNQSHRSQQPTR